MAHTSNLALALAARNHLADPDAKLAALSKDEQLAAAALLTPPNSISPDLPARDKHDTATSPPLINIKHDVNLADTGEQGTPMGDNMVDPHPPAATPLSKGALSGLDAAAAITPSMLAKDHLPGIMLGHGPKPIRYVMGELTHSVPGFSRIPPAKARRLVVAALESRGGGGPDGSVAFCKTGWGRWDAHVKRDRDSGVGSLGDTANGLRGFSPPRSERSSYAVSNGADSGVHMMPGPRLPAVYARDQYSGGSWTASSLREEDELQMEDMMDVPEHEADKMSLDEPPSEAPEDEDEDDSSMNDDTDDDDWAAVGPDALRKASLPTPGAPRHTYKALSIPGQGPWRGWSRRPSSQCQRSATPYSSSAPYGTRDFQGTEKNGGSLDPSLATPEEKAAVAALMQLGSM